MIKVLDIIRQVRIKQKDLHEVKFSDYDIEMAIDECMRVLTQAIALSNSSFAEKEIWLSENDINATLEEEEKIDFLKDGVELPEDLTTLSAVIRANDGYRMSPSSDVNLTDGQYRIFGRKLYSVVKEMRVQYKNLIQVEEFEDKDDNGNVLETYKGIDLPFILFDVIIKTTGMILNNEATDVMMETVSNLVKTVIPIQQYSNVKLKMPFKI